MNNNTLTPETSSSTPTTEEIKQLILDNPQLGISGHRNPNGADWYKCSGCFAEEPTTGYASTGDIDDIEALTHKPDCPLIKIRKWAALYGAA